MRGLRVWRVMVCLVVGVVATWVSSALIATALYRDWIKIDWVSGNQKSIWPDGVPSAWPPNPSMGRSDHLLLDVQRWVDEDGGFTDGYFRTSIDRFGWPTRSASVRSWRAVASWEIDPLDLQALSEFAQANHPDWSIITTGFESERHRVLIPLRPVWPGFLINTLFYASACWLLLAAPGGAVRWRRKRRGLCPKCGYALNDLDTCPECGT